MTWTLYVFLSGRRCIKCHRLCLSFDSDEILVFGCLFCLKVDTCCGKYEVSGLLFWVGLWFGNSFIFCPAFWLTCTEQLCSFFLDRIWLSTCKLTHNMVQNTLLCSRSVLSYLMNRFHSEWLCINIILEPVCVAKSNRSGLRSDKYKNCNI